MPVTNADTTHPSISDQILKSVKPVWKKVKNVLLSINNDKPPGSDNLDGKLLTIIADDIATSSI